MTQPEKKTVEQLLDMTTNERIAYLNALPGAERKTINRELLETNADRTVKKLVDSLNRNVLIEQLLDMPGAELRKYLEALPMEEYNLIRRELEEALLGNTLKNLRDNLNKNTKLDNDDNS